MQSASAAEMSTRHERIALDVQSAIEKLQESSFFEEVMRQLQDPGMIARIKKVVDQDPQCSQLQLVLYGVGSIESGRNPANIVSNSLSQLAFAILLREKFEWVNDIVVYDPDLTPVEQEALKLFNCSFLPVNEQCRRTADRPTLFFMPGLPMPLFQNLMMANWTPTNLNKMIILGNSFERMKEIVPFVSLIRGFKHLMAIVYSDNILEVVRLPRSSEPVYKRAFVHLSWHFFTPDASLDHLNLNLFPEDISDCPLEELQF